MEHPGEASTPFQGCILFGTVNGTIGENFSLFPPIDLTVSSLNQQCKRISRCDDLVLPQISIIVRCEINCRDRFNVPSNGLNNDK